MKIQKPKAGYKSNMTVPSKSDSFETSLLKQTRDPYKFDEDAQRRALVAYAHHGTYSKAAAAASVCMRTIRNKVRDDAQFAELWEEALMIFRDKMEEIAYDIAFKGTEVPIIGGKDKDQIIAYTKKYEPRIIELMLKKFNPEYREKQLALPNGAVGGVLVVGAPLTNEELVAEYGNKELPAIDVEGQVVQ
jgi:hypothetical protein